MTRASVRKVAASYAYASAGYRGRRPVDEDDGETRSRKAHEGSTSRRAALRHEVAIPLRDEREGLTLAARLNALEASSRPWTPTSGSVRGCVEIIAPTSTPSARRLLDGVVDIHHASWVAEHAGVYVPSRPRTRPQTPASASTTGTFTLAG